VAKDFGGAGLTSHTVFEALVAFALFAGTALSARELRRVIEDMRRAEQAVSAASGALAEVIEAHFALWNLTAAEAEVALLALKGFDVAEIAGLRGVAQGTVRAQLARIYEKAGVTNRAGLLALFIEELLGEPLPPARPVPGPGSSDGA
jgi:DNA-binding CsgD family transcriptional regulator